MDLLEINIYMEDDLKKEYRVTESGYISYPFIGNIKVAGLTTVELEQKVAESLGKDYFVNPRATVFVKEYHLSKVYVLGEVRSPGAYEIPMEKDLALVELISMAGGFTESAQINGTTISRVGKEADNILKVRVSDVTLLGDKSKDAILQPNDTIVVPKAPVVYVLGEVKSPGSYKLPSEKPLTILELISMTGGFTESAQINGIIINRSDEGIEKVIPVRMSDITAGDKSKNLTLMPSDSVVVPKAAKVFILGEVRNAGSYDLPSDKALTALELISLAGGFTDTANIDGTMISRLSEGVKQTVVVNASAITKYGDKTKDVVLKPGDTVIIPKTARVYILGQVKSPGSYNVPLEKELTLIELISMAGGFTDIADINKTKIVRTENGVEKNITVKVDDITKRGDKSKDVVLKANDVIIVPESFF